MREMAATIKRMRRAGFKVTMTGSGHHGITHRSLTTPIFAASTPSDRRAIPNLQAMIRRQMQAQPQTPSLEIPQ